MKRPSSLCSPTPHPPRTLREIARPLGPRRAGAPRRDVRSLVPSGRISRMNESGRGDNQEQQGRPRVARSGRRSGERAMRLHLSASEMDRLSADALEAGFGRGEHAHRGRYVRSILLARPALPYPTWPQEPSPVRELSVRVSLSAQDYEALSALVEAAGTQTERYARWRLFGVVD